MPGPTPLPTENGEDAIYFFDYFVVKFIIAYIYYVEKQLATDANGSLSFIKRAVAKVDNHALINYLCHVAAIV